ncbi:MAG: DUF975 family protein [Lachnospiraceae bacterium]|nr:DUF975 family protein [Lachnospiraceae bacterium]
MEPINRKVLKENAKIALKNNFWMVMLITFVGSLLGVGWNGLSSGSGFNGFVRGFSNGFSSRMNTSSEDESVKLMLEGIADALDENIPGADIYFDYDDNASLDENMSDFLHELEGSVHLTDEFVGTVLIVIGIILLIILLIYILSVCIQFAIGSFVNAPITVGYYRYFMKNRKQQANFMDLFAVFSKGNYMKVVKVMFATNIRIWAWSLLFYFPGLVKAYQYYFVPYIMAENTNISKERAREISRKMTDGHKWQIFVLQLSFLGWAMLFVLEEIFLGLISCGLLAIPGVLLIYPLVGYQMATYAELYEERREYALMTGIATEKELIGF